MTGTVGFLASAINYGCKLTSHSSALHCDCLYYNKNKQNIRLCVLFKMYLLVSLSEQFFSEVGLQCFCIIKLPFPILLGIRYYLG